MQRNAHSRLEIASLITTGLISNTLGVYSISYYLNQLADRSNDPGEYIIPALIVPCLALGIGISTLLKSKDYLSKKDSSRNL
jgi:hypothetical protein